MKLVSPWGEESSGGFHDNSSSFTPVDLKCKSSTRVGPARIGAGSGWTDR